MSVILKSGASSNEANVTSAGALQVDGSAVTQPVSIAATVPVSISGTVPVSASSNLPVAVSGTVPVSVAATLPVSIASTVSVSGAVTASWSTPQQVSFAAAQPVTVSGGPITLWDGTNTAAVKAASVPPVGTDTAQVVALSPNGYRTYAAATGATASAGTGVVLQVQGSATKLVRIVRVGMVAYVSTAASAIFKFQRCSTTATAGTSAVLPAGTYDTNNPSATAVVTHWTATGGTTGTTVGGPIMSQSLSLQVVPTSTAAVSNEGFQIWVFGAQNQQEPTLRGTSDFMTLTCSGTLSGSYFWVEWTEE